MATARKRCRFSKLVEGCLCQLVDIANPVRLQEKEEQLFANLRALERVIVAFSGGTDSAYLAWAAHHVLGANALAMTADSASLPESHKRDAEAFVQRFGIAHEYVQTHEFDNPGLRPQRSQPLLPLQGRVVHACCRKSAASAAIGTSSTA